MAYVPQHASPRNGHVFYITVQLRASVNFTLIQYYYLIYDLYFNFVWWPNDILDSVSLSIVGSGLG